MKTLELTDQIRKYFGKIGLSDELADLYMALGDFGPQSISELSRNSRIERTRVYRLLDDLKLSNLVETETYYGKELLKAAPFSNVKSLIAKRELELLSLKDDFELISGSLASNELSSPAAKVKFYAGPEGIRQMLNNQLRASSEIASIAYQHLSPTTGTPFANNWLKEFSRRNLESRVIYGNDYFKSTPNTYKDPKKVVYKLIPQKKFLISSTIDVYDNVNAFFIWKDAKVYGYEVIDQSLADHNRQIFEMLWEIAEDR